MAQLRTGRTKYSKHITETSNTETEETVATYARARVYSVPT